MLGGTPENAERLKAAFNKQDEYAKGIAFGFPVTAVEAFVRGEGISLPPTLSDDPGVAFAEFIFSPNHFQEELMVGDRWARAVRDASPTIYEGFMAEHQG